MLPPHRVLDLSSGGYLICGQILADLGANVVLVEPPDGSATRSEGPFLDDTPDREGSRPGGRWRGTSAAWSSTSIRTTVVRR